MIRNAAVNFAEPTRATIHDWMDRGALFSLPSGSKVDFMFTLMRLMAEGTGLDRLVLIYCGMRLRQHKGRNLDVKLLLTLINHLVGAVHRAEGYRQRAT